MRAVRAIRDEIDARIARAYDGVGGGLPEGAREYFKCIAADALKIARWWFVGNARLLGEVEVVEVEVHRTDVLGQAE